MWKIFLFPDLQYAVMKEPFNIFLWVLQCTKGYKYKILRIPGLFSAVLSLIFNMLSWKSLLFFFTDKSAEMCLDAQYIALELRLPFFLFSNSVSLTISLGHMLKFYKISIWDVSDIQYALFNYVFCFYFYSRSKPKLY